MRILKLQYQLDRAEIEEALLCLDYKREGRFRDVNVGIISLIGAGTLVAYVRNTRQFFWIVLSGVMVLLLLYMIYAPVFGRRYRAEKIAGDKGTYNLEIRNNKIQYGDQKNSVEITGKNTKAYISDKLYVLRINREVFTIPKRIMKEGEKSELEKILRENSSGIVHITIERGEKL